FWRRSANPCAKRSMTPTTSAISTPLICSPRYRAALTNGSGLSRRTFSPKSLLCSRARDRGISAIFGKRMKRLSNVSRRQKTAVVTTDFGPEGIAAELTAATYFVALRHGAGNGWLDLELELWRALTDAINKQHPDASTCGAVTGRLGGMKRKRWNDHDTAHFGL